MKYIVFTLFVLVFYWGYTWFNSTASQKESIDSFDNAAHLNQKKISIKPDETNQVKPSKNILPSVKITDQEFSSLTFEEVEEKLIKTYKLPQDELAESLPLLKQYKKRLEIALALKDQVIDSALLLDPGFRIALSIYLDVSPHVLNEQQWISAKTSPQEWNKLVNFSQSNDFRILLKEGNLSRQEIRNRIK